MSLKSMFSAYTTGEKISLGIWMTRLEMGIPSAPAGPLQPLLGAKKVRS